VLEATSRLRSYRVDQTAEYRTTDNGGGVTSTGSGVTDVAARRSEMTLAVSNSTVRETVLLAGSRTFERLAGPPPAAQGWCWMLPTKEPGPEVSAIATLASLAGSDRTVIEIGSEVVRSVGTTYYALTGGNTNPVDIWVDSSDQLRRIRWTQTGSTRDETISMDLFAFNAPVTIDDIPAHAPACRF
jgi:hypothetical protein